MTVGFKAIRYVVVGQATIIAALAAINQAPLHPPQGIANFEVATLLLLYLIHAPHIAKFVRAS